MKVIQISIILLALLGIAYAKTTQTSFKLNRKKYYHYIDKFAVGEGYFGAIEIQARTKKEYRSNRNADLEFKVLVHQDNNWEEDLDQHESCNYIESRGWNRAYVNLKADGEWGPVKVMQIPAR